MNISITANVLIMQSRRFYVNIPMNTSVIANVTTTQQCGFYVNIPMNTSPRVNVTTIQRRIFNANTSKGYIHHDECSHHATRYELFF